MTDRPRTRNQISVAAQTGTEASQIAAGIDARAPEPPVPLGERPGALTPPVALGQDHFRASRNRNLVPRPGGVTDIIADVQNRGDTALHDLARKHDFVALDSLEVSREACQRALDNLNPKVRFALEDAAANIAAFHRAQLPEPFEIETAPGVRLGRRAEPLRRVGVYAPGGRASYPSSVLMGVVPARVAGVGEVIACSPPGPDGLPPAAILAACALSGADRVFAIGGAGAIAAMAYGTSLVPRVDKIVGPGNAYVTEAKRLLSGVVAIDGLAGPSEILIIADDSADPVLAAVELVAQAEHDSDAACVLVGTDLSVLERTGRAVERLLQSQPRADVIRAALSANGALLHASSLREALDFAEAWAPEHLLVMTREPRSLLPSLRAAGTIFLGAPSSVAFGDYMTGANHVLPTGGLARSSAGLSTADFLRWTTYQELTPAAAATLAGPTATLAEAEGLPGHALAARLRGTMPPQSSVAAPATASPATASPAAASPAATPTTEPPALRTAYADLSPYDPGRWPCAVDLSDNTSLFGAAPSVRKTLAELRDDDITRYPSVYADELRQRLAELHGVEPANIATGCGSDDVIDSALRAFCDPGDSIAWPDPTFSMVPAFARMNALCTTPVPLLADCALDTDTLIGARARITYVCRPNNPTGTSFDRAATVRLCREAAGIVLIDEAYADYADDDFVADAVVSDRVVVLRTLSKAYGLAGMRIGYAVGPERLIAEIEKSRGPYKVSRIAEAAAMAVLAQDRAWVDANIAEVRRNRTRLRDELRSRGVPTAESAANFLLLTTPGASREWDRRLRDRGVAVRPFTNPDRLRVSIGPWPLMQRFLEVFDDVLATMTGE